MDSGDVIVIGGGMAGASLGYELATDRRVIVLEQESAVGFHTTGRSAAMFLETYGGPAVRALTVASRAFLAEPPETFDRPLLTPRPYLTIGPATPIRHLYQSVRELAPDVELLDGRSAERLNPLIRPGYAQAAVLEPAAMSIDVHAQHHGYLRGLRSRGGEVVTNAQAVTARRERGAVGAAWVVSDGDGRSWRAPVVVIASGAWADRVAAVFGARSRGLRPLRRTIFLLDPPALDVSAIPLTGDVGETFYIKPEAGQLLCSPAEETLQEPGDARADEMAIARALDVIARATVLDTRHVRRRWAGLRTFAPDRAPVVGFDPDVDGLFWFAGQGGYGIQLAPALARVGAALVRGAALPADVAAHGLTAATLDPSRLA
jgi:D-arginine dehydrogenase